MQNLPNIGDEMARFLQQAGINSPDELKRIGSIKAAILVSPHRRSGSVCRSALSALEGAIRGVGWHSIPKQKRDTLWEEYVNPHTGKVEVDTDAYKYRWKTDGGDVYYTNREDENPNLFLQRTDYKRTPIRKRKNE